ncbi:MAG: aspartate--tRNA ligase [Deltaproteobacteria bacterium]|jgi:aspartyl-tRNA synthetase
MSGEKLITERKRTHMCGDLRADHEGQEVVLMGWVQTARDHGGAVFFDLRDRTGIVQVVFDESEGKDVHTIAERVRSEWVIGIVGKVRSRGANVNPNIATGAIEIAADSIEVFNEAKTPPFEIEDDIDTAEEKRLVHRYLDLRRPRIQRNLMLRSKLNHVVRKSLVDQGFIELETPFMVKYTPGGARNFLVPSRLSQGCFYALAESPQLYKQLFMMSGFDRYFQITKCFRDEDLRNDRQPEFTQIDLEMSFADMDDVHTVMTKVVRGMFKEALDVELPEQFPRMTYDEAMRRFGSDKPDLRFGLEHITLTDLVKANPDGGLPLFEQAVAQGGMVKAMVVPAEHKLSRKDVDNLEAKAKEVKAKGLGRAKVNEDGGWTQSPFAKTVKDEVRLAINEACGAKPGDLILFQFGPEKLVQTVMNHLRLLLGKQLDLIPPNTWSVLWVVEFPLFEYSEENKTYVAAHHPFTSPRAEDVDRLTTDPGACRARAYDLVLNGNEIAGGSVRIHDPIVQAKVFDALSISEEEQRAKFGFLLDALSYGCPPHAGIAGGMDRIAMLIAGASSLREVIPFPKTQKGQDLMTGAPTPVDDAQLAELSVKSIAPRD